MEGEEEDPQTIPNPAVLPFSLRRGAWRGQDGAAAVTAKLLSRVQLHLSKAPSLRGFPQFSPVLPTSVLLSLEKDEMRGTRGCKTPQIGLEACAGGKKGLRGAGGAWVFSLFSEPPNSPRLPHLQVPCARTEDAEGLPPLPQGLPHPHTAELYH